MPTHLAGLYLICCLNWIPSSNNSNVTFDRAKLLYLLDQRFLFNFGKLVYDQVEQAARSPDKVKKLLPFPNLIYRVLSFQRELPLAPHEKLSSSPKPLLPDVRGGSGTGRSKQRTSEFVLGRSLAADLKYAATIITDIAHRVEGGEYSNVATEQGDSSQGYDNDSDDSGSESEADDPRVQPVRKRFSSRITKDVSWEPEYSQEGFRFPNDGVVREIC